jgi:SAM-dependent methyltransferase
VAAYYNARLTAHGPSAQGVDWNSVESQQLRFAQLLRILEPGGLFTLNDFGCGYGALADFLAATGRQCQYTGYDLSSAMVEAARRRDPGRPDCAFTADATGLTAADFTVASGVFNVKLAAPAEDWLAYLLRTLDRLDGLSRLGFAFNALTSYSDPERMRPDLYYADPCFLFDHCQRRYARDVALLHDYGLYEFTILVRKKRAAG